jgi:hypothetical protein
MRGPRWDPTNANLQISLPRLLQVLQTSKPGSRSQEAIVLEQTEKKTEKQTKKLQSSHNEPNKRRWTVLIRNGRENDCDVECIQYEVLEGA